MWIKKITRTEELGQLTQLFLNIIIPNQTLILQTYRYPNMHVETRLLSEDRAIINLSEVLSKPQNSTNRHQDYVNSLITAECPSRDYKSAEHQTIYTCNNKGVHRPTLTHLLKSRCSWASLRGRKHCSSTSSGRGKELRCDKSKLLESLQCDWMAFRAFDKLNQHLKWQE